MHDWDSRRGTVRVSGARLGYLIEGRGVPVLIPGSAGYYERAFAAGLRRYCRLAFTDLRHFCAEVEPGSPPPTLQTYLDDIERQREALGFRRFALLGHSHHGNLALEYARRHPARVSHLVMIGSPPCDVEITLLAADRYWHTHADAARKAAHARRQAADPQSTRLTAAPGHASSGFIAQYLADGARYWYDPERDASFLWRDVPVDMPSLQAFKTFFAEGGYRWNPAQLDVPSLVVMGRHDYVVPHTLWEPIVRSGPKVSYHLFDHSGHTPQLEEPALFQRTLLHFLRDWVSGEEVS